MSGEEVSLINYTKQDGVAEIQLSRPEVKNAINIAMYAAMHEAIVDAEADPSVRVMIITGTEENFTSGNDLADFANFSEAMAKPEEMPLLKFMASLKGATKPVIAAVEGVAVGIGTTLLLHCDLIYAKADARFKLPFIHLGLCPEYASSVLLPQLVGHAKASEWLLLGEEFSGEAALASGLINEVVDNPLERARERAAVVAKLAPNAVKVSKALLKHAQKGLVEETMADEFKKFGEALKGPEFAEAVGAFFEKREPDFSKL